jgi:hypothetical protein
MHCSEQLSVDIKYAIKTYNLLAPNLIAVSSHLDSHAVFSGDDKLSKTHNLILITVAGEISQYICRDMNLSSVYCLSIECVLNVGFENILFKHKTAFY